MIALHKLVNSPITSNCYILIHKETKSCLVIDPGTYDNNDHLLSFITKNNLTVSQVILTHEHFDHLAGIDKLYSEFQFELICSIETAKGISNSKKNLSAFNDQMLPIEIKKTPLIVEDTDNMFFANNKLTFYYTPGHSTGSMCFTYNQYFFSGDTLLYEQKTRLNLPGSNKKQFQETLIRLKQIAKPGMQICPGHGISFTFELKHLDSL